MSNSPAKKLGKRAAARLARQFVAKLITHQDTPDWLFDVAGVSPDDEDSQGLFDDAIEALAEKLDPTLRERISPN